MTPKARSLDDELTVEAATAARAGAADTEIALGSLAGKSSPGPADPTAAGELEAEAAVLATEEPEGAAAPRPESAGAWVSAAGSLEGALAEAAVLASGEPEGAATPVAESTWAPASGSVEGLPGEVAAREGSAEAFVGAQGGVVSPGAISAAGGLAALLESVLVGEPPVADGVDRVYRRAETLRRRRLRRVVASGAVAALLVAAVGYVLTAAVIPGVRHDGGARVVSGPTPNVDPLLTALGPVVLARGLRAVPREPSRGEGWRQYSVFDRQSGRPRGLIEVSAYAAPDGICFPVGDDPKACARPMLAGDGVEYARYSDDRDPDWQMHEAIARRLSDGRVIAVMATGERGTGDADAGRPPLSVAETAELAVGVPVMSAFDPSESCNGPDPGCPILKVPVPLDR